MTGESLVPGEVRTGEAYETGRAAGRMRLAAAAAARRVDLGADLVLVFESRDSVRAALEELLRAERVSDPARVADEHAALAALAPGDNEIAATLYLDVADPAALADRLAELGDLGAGVGLEVDGATVAARCDDADAAAGALHLVFALEPSQLRALDGGTVAVVVDHRGGHQRAVLADEQVRSVSADLQR